ncbi:MAG: transglutaminase-like cysteine peptidase [Kiloniellales bacterium]
MLTALLVGLTVSGAPANPISNMTGGRDLAAVVSALSDSTPAPFGTKAIPTRSRNDAPQWKAVLARMPQSGGALADCPGGSCSGSSQALWQQLLHAAGGATTLRQLQLVNSFLNRWPYRRDSELYGSSDRWATPAEFLVRSGDCEDFAIAKYFALRALGVPAETMRVVAVEDQIQGQHHAVLTVALGTETLVLDSRSNLILPDRRYRHYRPLFSVNETGHWLHLDRRSSDALETAAGS